MAISDATRYVVRQISSRRRSRAIRRLLADFVKPGDLVFDVGANVGDMTREFLTLGARVVAFEPQEDCCEHLAERFANADVVVEKRALSDRDGTATLQIPQANTIASITPDWIEAVRESGRFSEFDWNHAEEVTTGRLDAAIEKYGEPAFCKIDVEGHEEAVINGLSRALRVLSLEFVPEHRDGLIRAVERLGGFGAYEWNFAPFDDGGDSARFEFAEWMPQVAFTTFLRDFARSDAGNIYGRLHG